MPREADRQGKISLSRFRQVVKTANSTLRVSHTSRLLSTPLPVMRAKRQSPSFAWSIRNTSDTGTHHTRTARECRFRWDVFSGGGRSGIVTKPAATLRFEELRVRPFIANPPSNPDLRGRKVSDDGLKLRMSGIIILGAVSPHRGDCMDLNVGSGPIEGLGWRCA
jgi:hypothetical protein